MPIGKHLRIFAVIAVASVASIGTARADMLVLESTVSGFKAGDHVEADAIGSLPPGTYLKVLDREKNTTTILRGPAKADLPFGGTRGFRPKPRE